MKDADLRRFLGLTWAGWLYCLLLQWLGLRLCREVEDDDTISAWALRWAPIWQMGWAVLPTFRRRVWKHAHDSRPRAHVPRPGRILLRVSEPVAPGDLVAVGEDGQARRATPVVRRAIDGEFVTSAQAGGVATVSLRPFPKVDE